MDKVRSMDRQTEQMDGWMDGWMDTWTDGWKAMWFVQYNHKKQNEHILNENKERKRFNKR